MTRKTWFLVATVAGGVLLGRPVQPASAEGPFGSRHRPLEGQRYETLRALAHHLDETAGGALEGAADDARRRPSAAPRFLSAIRSFARRAGVFRTRLDGYESLPFEVMAQVDDLTTRAHEVNDHIRSAGTLGDTYGDWTAVLDVLGRMRSLLAGGDVTVPAAHVVAPLSGPKLHEFRQLARDLDLSATRAHETAKREAGTYPDRGRQFLGELEHFAAQTRDLHSRAGASQIDPQQIGPLVDRILKDARLADRSLRDARVFASVWDDSGRTITILQRMASLVRS